MKVSVAVDGAVAEDVVKLHEVTAADAAASEAVAVVMNWWLVS